MELSVQTHAQPEDGCKEGVHQQQCVHWLGNGRKACARAGCLVPGPRDAGRRARHIQQGMPKFQLSEILNRVLFRLM